MIIIFEIIDQMIALQLPSLQEIYDYSSSDLQKFANEINQKLNTSRISQEEQLKYSDYLENIKIQLEQRKTLEFFQELCAVDNPYIKKVTDFNNEFLKLASEAIAAQESIVKPFQKKQLQEISEDKQDYQGDVDAVSVTSAIAHKSRLTENNIYKSTNGYEDKAYTVVSEKRSTFGDNEKKIPTGKTKVKSSMKDFILSTLSKNKVEGCYVVKKSGNGPQKPQPGFTVNQRGHVVNANTLEPISMKSIKSSSTAKEKNQTSSATSNKQMESHNKINQKQLEKKRLEAIEKVKNVKSEKKKEKNNFNNKELLEMVRQEQKEKEKKEKRNEVQKYSSVTTQNDSEKQNKSKIEEAKNEITICITQNKVQKLQAILSQQQVLPQKLAQQKVEQIRQIIEIQEQTKQKDSQSQKSNQQIKQQIKHEQTQIQPIPKRKQSIKIEIKQKITLPIAQKTVDRIEKIPDEENIMQLSQTQILPQDKTSQAYKANKANEFQNEMDQLIRMKQQLQQQNTKIVTIQAQKIQNRQIEDKDNEAKNNNDFGRIIDVAEEQIPSTQNKNEKQQANKKCYNEQYWIHIREQAQSQIKRFKVEKELEEFSKKNIKSNIERSISAKVQNSSKEATKPESQAIDSNSTSENEERVSEVADEDAFIDKRKKQLAKMINDHNKRVMPKKHPLPIIAPQKPLYSLPSFNYLEIYPTFNHIFSVMYTKAEHQALQDIPMIMKDLTNMFTTHLQHFKDKASYFKPAVFLPFDISNNFQVSNPKQLLLHAQNTYVNLKKLVERLEIFNGNLHGQFNDADNRYYRVVKTKQEVYDIISTGFLRRKSWKQLPHGCSLRSSWNLFWSWSKPDIDISKLLVWQRINHFPFNKNLSRKDLLYKNLDSFRKMLKIPFNFLPLTYNLPKEFTQFSIKFHEQQIVNRDLNYWIMKPIGKSRGRGIKVINNLAQLNYTDNIIVQKYIINPLLLDGYKFDMRIYVLVTNFHPLEAFVYKEGFARLSTQKFSLEPMFIKNTFVHLTNFAINRNNEEAKQTAAFSGGSKISLKVLKDKITKMGYSFNNVWSQCHEIIIKSLLGCSISVPPFPTAFELFGYDIMIDTEGSCHLIEINASPSLQRTYLIDEIVKQSLIDDILDIVDPPNFNKQNLLDIMSERLSGKKKITPEEDLIAIARVLDYKPIRKFGEIPENLGLFEMIAPSKLSTDLQKQIKGRSGANNPKNID